MSEHAWLKCGAEAACLLFAFFCVAVLNLTLDGFLQHTHNSIHFVLSGFCCLVLLLFCLSPLDFALQDLPSTIQPKGRQVNRSTPHSVTPLLTSASILYIHCSLTPVYCFCASVCVEIRRKIEWIMLTLLLTLLFYSTNSALVGSTGLIYLLFCSFLIKIVTENKQQTP